HGLLRPRCVPPAPQREWRELPRYRMRLGEERARLINRLHKTLEEAHLQRASVVSDGTGPSARALLTALLAGEVDPAVLADLTRGRMRSKRAQLTHVRAGHRKPHQRVLLSQQLADMDAVQAAIERLSSELAVRVRP